MKCAKCEKQIDKIAYFNCKKVCQKCYNVLRGNKKRKNLLENEYKKQGI